MILKKDIHTNKVNKFPGFQEYNVLDCGMMKKVIPESGTKFSNLTHQNLLSTILLGSFDLYSSTAIIYNYNYNYSYTKYKCFCIRCRNKDLEYIADLYLIGLLAQPSLF